MSAESGDSERKPAAGCGVANGHEPALCERYHWLVIGVYTLAAVVCAGLAWLQLQQIERHVDDVARERGAVLFRLIELTRNWNARHGGVYVPITETSQPNTYLRHPKRDVVTTDGVQLTLVNPAYMTRQIAELAALSDGVQIHITSLRPIRPANKPDAWEHESLVLFEDGLKERLTRIDQPSGAVHRYMAPLLVTEACMKCHAVQGYKVGQIRGGISVTMPAGGLIANGAGQKTYSLWIAGVTFLVIGLLAHFAISRMRRRYIDLSDLTRAQERTIAERTHELAARAGELEREVDERRRSQQRLAESEARYRSVIESSQDGVLVLDGANIVLANERLGDILGMRPEELVGRDLASLIADADRDWVMERHLKRMRGEPVQGIGRVRLRHQNPRLTRIADMHVMPLHEGASGQWAVAMRDMTLQVRNERELLIAAAVFEHAAEGVMVTDADNRILRVNPAFTAITGYTPGEVIGHGPDMLGSGRHDAAFFQQMWDTLEQREHWEGEIWNRHKNGNLYVAWLAITTIPEDAGDAGRYVATFIDISQRKRAEELLLHKAQHDPLTDLPNRILLDDHLDNALAAAHRYGRKFGLLALDLDHFKEVNDTLGHDAGDELLIAVAKHLLSCVREVDTVARIGGDEFVILLNEVSSAAEVEQVARRALELLVRPFNLRAGPARVSASIGMAIYPEHGEDAGALRRNADRALYAVKNGGRNDCRFYAPGM